MGRLWKRNGKRNKIKMNTDENDANFRNLSRFYPILFHSNPIRSIHFYLFNSNMIGFVQELLLLHNNMIVCTMPLSIQSPLHTFSVAHEWRENETSCLAKNTFDSHSRGVDEARDSRKNRVKSVHNRQNERHDHRHNRHNVRRLSSTTMATTPTTHADQSDCCAPHTIYTPTYPVYV